MSELVFKHPWLTFRCVETSSSAALPLRRFDVFGRDERGEELLCRVAEDRHGNFSGDLDPSTRFERAELLLEKICSILTRELRAHPPLIPSSTVSNWSDFVREPTSVLPQLDRGKDVILRRRDGAALFLSTTSRAASSNLGTELAARVASEILGSARESVGRAAETVLASRFPWVRLLPKEARMAFLQEFLSTLEACASVSNMSRLAELVSDWKATAEVYSDPQLADALTRPIHEPVSIPVPRPAGARAKRAESPSRHGRRAKAG